jgi:hypothetical protein
MTTLPETKRTKMNDAPWQAWKEQVMECRLHDLEVCVDDSRSRRASALLLFARTEQNVLGCCSDAGLHALGAAVDFPPGFVLSLPPRLRADVINARIRAHADREVGIVSEDGSFITLIPGGREPLSSAETAQAAYDAVCRHVGRVTVERADRYQNRMALVMMTPVEKSVTPRVGDILKAGLRVIQEFGHRMSVDLLAERLVCLNGMTREWAPFRWRRGNESGREKQLCWLRQGIAEALGAFDDLVVRARRMATTVVDGEAEEALLHRAAALGFPRRHHDRLRTAFREEPGDTEWHLLNAVTRVATHAALPNGLGRRLQATAGEWVRSFDLVTARLPRPVAMQVGAHILELTNQ